jgi:hypothetical protein
VELGGTLGLIMRPDKKFLRVVLAATLGALLWAGCASDRRPAPKANVDTPIVLDWQENLTRPHIDTHPERRQGWAMAFPTAPYMYPHVGDFSSAIDQPEF